MVRKNVAEILTNHVTFELEAIDRMYLNAYVPSLQTGGGFVYFVKSQLGARVPSTMMVAPMSQHFVEAIERFVATEGIDLVTFEKGQRKDDVAQEYLADVRRRGGRPLRRQGPREGERLPHREAARRAREDVPLDHPLDRDGQSLLRLPRRPGLRPAVHQVLFVLPVPREALSEWARVAETAADAAGDSVRAVGQWDPLERRRPPACNGSPTRWTPPRSTRSFASGCADSRIPSPRRIARPAIAITSRSCKPSSR